MAASLKKLMNEVPFSKINIADICENCQMNRKSFYYHFRDKYELVNWIFDTEFIEVAKKSDCSSADKAFDVLFGYFYDNRHFYRKALQINGQNSFSDHFHQLCKPVFTEMLANAYEDEKVTEFHVNFLADALMCSILRWLTEPKCMPADEFSFLLKSSLRLLGAFKGNETVEMK